MPYIRLWWLLHSQWCGIFVADFADVDTPCSATLHMGLLRLSLFEAIDSIDGLCMSRFQSTLIVAILLVECAAVFRRRRGLSPVCFLSGDSHCRNVLLRLSRVCSRKGGTIHSDKPKAQKTDSFFYSVFVRTTT